MTRRSGARNVEIAAVGVGGHIIEAAVALDELDLLHLVGTAVLRVSQAGSIVPIEDVTGAQALKTGTPARQLVEVIGYPDSGGQPIVCRNWTREPMSEQLEFDCGGYTDGTSGGPFLASVNPLTGQGTVIGVIGGYEQGGLTPQISYSSRFGANVAALYRQAVAGG